MLFFLWISIISSMIYKTGSMNPWIHGAHSDLEIVKWWNGVTTEDEIGVIAIKANGPIEKCVWIHQDTGDEYSSEVRADRDRFVEVEIIEEDAMCKLRVKKANINDHDGLWDVEITGKCNKEGRSSRNKWRTKRQIAAFPSSTIDTGTVINSSVNSRKPIRRRGNPTLRRNSGNTRRKSSRVRSDCDVNAYVEDIELFVAEKSSTNNRDAEVKILEGQKEVYGAKDEKTFLTARTSQKPKKCLIKEDGRGDIILETTGRRRRCKKYKNSNVCLKIYEVKEDGIFGCQFIIDKMKDDHEQFYHIEANGEEDLSVEIELIYVEKPSKTTIEIDGQKYEGANSRKDAKVGDGEHTIICNAKDGQKTRNQEVECGLWIGTQPFVDAKDFNCQDADRDDVCVEFEADLYKDEHDGLELYCQCLPKGVVVDKSSRNNDFAIARVQLKIDKNSRGNDRDSDRDQDRCQGRDCDHCAPSLTGVRRRSEKYVTVCADRAQEGDYFDIDIEFEANPKPDKITWEMQVEKGRNSQTVKEGKSKRGYEALDIEEDRNIDNRYIATMRIDRLDRDDFEENNHKLIVENDEDKIEFIITISDKRNCDPTQNPGDEEEGFCSENNKNNPKDDNEDDEILDKARQIFLDSCLKMSSTLLDAYTPEGDRRDSGRDRDIKNDLEDFFESAKCSGYDRDVVEYFEDHDRKWGRYHNRDPKTTFQNNNDGQINFANGFTRNKVSMVARTTSLMPSQQGTTTGSSIEKPDVDFKNILQSAAEVKKTAGNLNDTIITEN